MGLFTALASAARTVDGQSTTLSIPRDAPIRVYNDCTVHSTAYTLFLEEEVNGKWFPLANSGSITGTGQSTFAAPAARTSGRIRVRYDVGDATFAVYVAIAGPGIGGAKQHIALASAARQADANSIPFVMPPDSTINLYCDVTVAAGDDTAIVRLQEEIESKWYDLAILTISATTVATYGTSAAGGRGGGPLRVQWDHTVVTTADDIEAEVRVAA